MSNSTTNLDYILSSQSAKEVVANALFDAMSPDSAFGRRASTSAGLTWGYYGGVMVENGVPTFISNGTLTLANAVTSYIYLTADGVIHNVTSAPAGWPGPLVGRAVALYDITTASSLVTSYNDWRVGKSGIFSGGNKPQAVSQSGANITLDFRAGNIATTISANITGITLNFPYGEGTYFWYLTGDGTHTVTWPGGSGIQTPAAGIPTQSTGAGHVTIYAIRYDGTTAYLNGVGY